MLYHFQDGRFVGATKQVANQTRQDVNQVCESATPTQFAKIQAIREAFDTHGVPIATWARAHGIEPMCVHDLLRGKSAGRRGASHRAALLLGLKEGKVIDVKSFKPTLVHAKALTKSHREVA